MSISPPVAVFALVFVPMLAESLLSARNEQRLRARGALEPQDDVIRRMQIAYPAAFVGMIAEAWWRPARFDMLFGIGLLVFIASKLLKYWAIIALGPRWTFRVLVPPGSRRTSSGPYRILAHPNYVAVAGELVAAALMLRAIVTGPVATLFFIHLMRRRVAVEERALRSAQ